MEMKKNKFVNNSLIKSINEADRDNLNIPKVVTSKNVNDHNSDYTDITDETISQDRINIDDSIRFTIVVKLSESVQLFYLRNTVEVLSYILIEIYFCTTRC